LVDDVGVVGIRLQRLVELNHLAAPCGQIDSDYEPVRLWFGLRAIVGELV
jgi:hypothetical protein